MSIKTIIFDWAGVFCSPGEPFAHPKLADETNLTVDQMGEKTKSIQALYYTGKITTTDFWSKAKELLGVNEMSEDELNRAYLSSYRLYPEMLALAEKLKKNYQTAILSNLTELMSAEITERHNLKDKFHHLFFSNEIGYAKPDERAFNFALNELQAKPEETIFIDDSATNVAAAQKIGLTTILFSNPNQCQAALKNLGIKV